jgi:Carboxypeptidase regulatory-like domain
VTGRAFVTASALAACLVALADRADACICARNPVAVNEPAGRVFFLDGRSKPEPLPGATVELKARGTQEIVAETTTEADGTFHLGGVRAGTYDLRVSLSGFPNAWVELRLRKRGRDLPRGVAVGVEFWDDCPCAPACATSPENGAITPRCLLG